MNEKIINLLQEKVLTLPTEKLIKTYQLFESIKGSTDRCLLEDLKEPYGRFNDGISYQIDLPYFLKSKQPSDNTTMIIAMDAMGSSKEEKVILSAPFFIQGDDGKNDYSYWKIINNIQSKSNVYLTDLYKLFFMKDNVPSNKNKEFISIKSNDEDKLSIHLSILKSEIEIIKPNRIITFGRIARDAIFSIYHKEPNNTITNDDVRKGYVIDNFTLIPIPHPSRSTRPSSWKTFYKNNFEKEFVYKDLIDDLIKLINSIDN